MSKTLENVSTYRSFPNPLNDFTFTDDDPSKSSAHLNDDHNRSSAEPNHDRNVSTVDRERDGSPGDDACANDRDSSDAYDTDLDSDDKGEFSHKLK